MLCLHALHEADDVTEQVEDIKVGVAHHMSTGDNTTG